MAEWIEIILRSVGLFIGTFVVVRIMGKRQVARATPFQYVTYGVIAILVALLSAKVIENMVLGIVALFVWIILPVVLEYLSLRSKMVHHWIYGKETVLIKDGKVMEESLKQMRLTGEELLRELRSKSAFNLADVEFAIMESTGEINIVMKADKKPITPHDLERKVAPQTTPQTVILDGNIVYEPLSNMGLNVGWLKEKLENTGVALNNVFIGQVDASGELYVDLFDDAIQLPQGNVKEMLYASFEKNQADLMKYALETQNKEAKVMYEKNAKQLEELMEKLRPYLLR